jgi:hypothetical protein
MVAEFSPAAQRGHVLVAIDPSVKGTGVAVFYEGVLAQVEVLRATVTLQRGNANLGEAVTSILTQARVNIPNDTTHPAHHVVMEIPEVYAGSNVKPGDLLAITAVGGALAGYYCESGVGELVTVLPKIWKGQVPKPIHNARTMGKLGIKERWLVDNCTCPAYLLNNAIDAVGLGLWFLDRK